VLCEWIETFDLHAGQASPQSGGKHEGSKYLILIFCLLPLREKVAEGRLRGCGASAPPRRSFLARRRARTLHPHIRCCTIANCKPSPIRLRQGFGGPRESRNPPKLFAKAGDGRGQDGGLHQLYRSVKLLCIKPEMHHVAVGRNVIGDGLGAAKDNPAPTMHGKCGLVLTMYGCYGSDRRQCHDGNT